MNYMEAWPLHRNSPPVSCAGRVGSNSGCKTLQGTPYCLPPKDWVWGPKGSILGSYSGHLHRDHLSPFEATMYTMLEAVGQPGSNPSSPPI